MTPTCRVSEGGNPRCLLGEGCRSQEIRGSAYKYIKQSAESGSNQCYPLDPLTKRAYQIMIIGSKPLQEDDFRGVPFQSNAGKKLFKFIEKSGLPTEYIYLTNRVKCAPPPKIKPSAKHFQACHPYIVEEIQDICPKMIILLGNDALKLFNLHNQGGINTIHGSIFVKKLPDWEDGPEFIVMPTFDPAMFLRKYSPSKEKRALDDFRKALAVLEGKEVTDHVFADFSLVDTMEKVDSLVEQLKKVSIFAFDTESPSLNYRVNPLTCISFCIGQGRNFVLPFYNHDAESTGLFKLRPSWLERERKEVIEKLRQVFEDPKISKAAHNIKYDMNVIRFHLGIILNGPMYDTACMHHLLDEDPPHKLEVLADVEFAYGNYSKFVIAIVGKGKKLKKTYDYVPDHILWPYTATDVEACYRLCALYFKQLQAKSHLWKLYVEETAPLQSALAEAEYQGCPIDLPIVEHMKKEVESQQVVLLDWLRFRVGDKEFNPSSTKQLVSVTKKLGYESDIIDASKSSGYTTNKNILTELAFKDEFFDKILEYRKNRKLLTTYLEKLIRDADKNNRAHYSFFQLTSSGRLSAELLHQIYRYNKKDVVDENNQFLLPQYRKPVMRDIFVVPDGYSYVYGDYSQVELRILALIAQDQEMLRIFSENGDIHLATTAEILNLPEEGIGTINIRGTNYQARAEDNRSNIGKPVNFGLAYGSTGYNLLSCQWVDINGRLHNVNRELLERGMKRWRSRFKGVSQYMIDIPNEGRSCGGVIVNCFGRERRFGSQLNAANKWERGAAEREAINYPIQSAAGGITNRTVHLVYSYLEQLGLLNDIILINTVHDSVAYQCKHNLVDGFVEKLLEIGQRPIKELFNYQFQMSIGISQHSWTEAELLAA